MWITAEAVKDIPDLEQFNQAVDNQIDKVNAEIERLDNDNYFEDMSEGRVKRWEDILELTPRNTDTLGERRFSVQSCVIDSLPYTFRILERELKALAGEDTRFERAWDTNGMTATVFVDVASEAMVDAIDELLDKKLPLDVVYSIVVLYNAYDVIARFTNDELSQFTYDQIKKLKTLGDYYVHNGDLYRTTNDTLSAYTHTQIHENPISESEE